MQRGQVAHNHGIQVAARITIKRATQNAPARRREGLRSPALCRLSALAANRVTQYAIAMTRLFDMDDRARLRERFYGATHSVLARL